MRETLVTVDAGHSAGRQSLVSARRGSRLFCKRHRSRCVATAAFGGVVPFQLLPHLLGHVEPMCLVLGRRIQFQGDMAPHTLACHEMTYQPRYECRWDMAVGAGGTNPDLIRVMHGVREFLRGRIHFVTRRAAKCFRGCVLQAPEESAGPRRSRQQASRRRGCRVNTNAADAATTKSRSRDAMGRVHSLQGSLPFLANRPRRRHYKTHRKLLCSLAYRHRLLRRVIFKNDVGCD
jgi:hypothetical protein